MLRRSFFLKPPCVGQLQSFCEHLSLFFCLDGSELSAGPTRHQKTNLPGVSCNFESQESDNVKRRSVSQQMSYNSNLTAECHKMRLWCVEISGEREAWQFSVFVYSTVRIIVVSSSPLHSSLQLTADDDFCRFPQPSFLTELLQSSSITELNFSC